MRSFTNSSSRITIGKEETEEIGQTWPIYGEKGQSFDIWKMKCEYMNLIK